MKKIILVVLVLIGIGIGFYEARSSSAQPSSAPYAQEPVVTSDFELAYYPTASHVSNGKLYVDGMFINQSDEYDIIDLEDMVIVLYSKQGERLAEIQVNDSFERSCSIGVNGGKAYNFSCAVSKVNADSHFDLLYDLEGTYNYTYCSGRNCSICLNANRFTGSPTANAPASKICTKCSGSGVCPECNGSRKNGMDGILGAFGCALCDKSGKCCYCNGRGLVSY